MEFELTAVLHEVKDGVIGYYKEFDGVITQGANREDCLKNLNDALKTMLTYKRYKLGNTYSLGGKKEVIVQTFKQVNTNE